MNRNQNLRPGQIYTRDVDTYAYLTQPLDVLGKRKRRIAVATKEVANTQAKYELARRQITQGIKLSYWIARGAQEVHVIEKRVTPGKTVQTAADIFMSHRHKSSLTAPSVEAYNLRCN